jgi:hypothetical protein
MTDTIEFTAEIKGDMIKLPDHLKKMGLRNVRVVIFKEEREQARKKKLPDGFYSPLLTPSYQIIGKRDELYDR